MKRNRLILTTGVLLVVASILCVFAIYFYALGVYELLPILYEEAELIPQSYILNIVINYIALIVLKVAQIIVFLILSIRIIVKGVRRVSVGNYKGTIISTMVIAYWSALMEVGTYHTYALILFVLFLASGILLTAVLTKKNESIQTAQSKVKHSAQKKESTKPLVDNVMIERVKIIKALRDDGALTEDQYFELMKQTIGFDISRNVGENINDVSKEDDDEGK